jgi:hypothetical protein
MAQARTKKKYILGEALTSELAPSAYFFFFRLAGWLAGWLAGNLSLYSSTVEHNTVNIMIDVRFILETLCIDTFSIVGGASYKLALISILL